MDKNEIQKLLNQAKKLIDKKKYPEAIEIYDKIIRIDSDDYVAYNHRGTAKHELEQYREAIMDYTKQ